MKLGDLVKSIKHADSLGFVVEIFDDLGADNPWIRVMFTHPAKTFQWVKMNGLVIVTEDDKKRGTIAGPSSSAP